MPGYVLLWFLPDAWFQVDLLAPDAEDRIGNQIRERLGGAEIDAEQLEQLIVAETAAVRHAAAEGVILLATYGEGELGPGELPAGLSLTLAVADLPATSSAPVPTPGEGSGDGGDFRSSAVPLVLADSEVKGFTRETRLQVDLPPNEGQIQQFQVQAFVVPADESVTAVVTVTTFDPEWEERARTVARTFADTLVFLDAG